MNEQNKKPLKPSTRCIENLNVDMGFTKTGLTPDKYEQWQEEMKSKHLSEAEKDLLIQNQLS